MKYKKSNKNIENDCLEKLCIYCLLNCKKHNKFKNTYNLIGYIRVKNNNILYYT